ncbi:MAG: ABC transporter permease [Deltaproteobacteria bacterium]
MADPAATGRASAPSDDTPALHETPAGVAREQPPVPALERSAFEPAQRVALQRGPTRPSLSYWQDAWRRLRKNKQALASLAIVVSLLVFTLFGPLVWRVDPNAPALTRISKGPSLRVAVRVLPDLPPFEEEVVAGVPPTPSADGASLAAPERLDWIGEPTIQAARMRWAAVPGAAGYLIYRSEDAPKGGYLGLPVGAIDGGNVLSFEDTFNLEDRVYYYSVVAKNVTESKQVITRRVKPAPGISLADAQGMQPAVQAGDTVRFPLRPFGTDSLGRDLLARLMAGARVSLYIGFCAPLFSLIIGVLIGGMSGYLGGKVDQWLMRITDFVIALPFLLFMILFKIALGAGPGQSGVSAMLIALVVLSWTSTARLTRGQVLQLRESEFVQASRLLGARPLYLLLRHLLPNTLGVILVAFTFAIPGAIFTEAFLSFIGMGVAPPTPSWGSMCNDGVQTFLTHPHELLFPALFISVAVLAFNLLGDGLRDALDPKMRSVE